MIHEWNTTNKGIESMMKKAQTKKKKKWNQQNKANIKIGILIVWSLNGKEEEIIDEMKPHKLDYLGLSEAKKKGKGVEEIKDE